MIPLGSVLPGATTACTRACGTLVVDFFVGIQVGPKELASFNVNGRMSEEAHAQQTCPEESNEAVPRATCSTVPFPYSTLLSNPQQKGSFSLALETADALWYLFAAL